MAGIHRRTIVSAAPSFGIKLEGPAKDLRNDEKVRKTYLGEG